MPARALVTEAGRVTGVIFEREGQEETAEAVRGVVLASGGFGANAEMRRKYIPQADAGWSPQPEGSPGDGGPQGLAVGGTTHKGNPDTAIRVAAPTIPRGDVEAA